MSISQNAMRFLPYILAGGFIFFGAQKFGAENAVFEIIAERSGIELFEPVIRRLTGVAELATALLFVLPFARAKQLASLSALGILGGAIGFHLSPWLGIHVPGIGHGLFITAVIMFVLNLFLLRHYLGQFRAEFPNSKSRLA